MHYITDIYPSTKRRLFLLDYDGTLVPFANRPHEAKPSTPVRNLLHRLASDPRNEVVVISGRDHKTLDTWFGDLPLSFSAEHGFWIRTPDLPWQSTSSLDTSWKATALQHIQQAIDTLPNSFLEEKNVSLAWHYRMSDADQAKHVTSKLLQALKPLQVEAGCAVLDGNKVVEVKPSNFDKGTAANHWLKQPFDFILAAGDDVTDEHLFAALPSHGHSIIVGDRPSSIAKERLSREAFLALLETFAAKAP